MILLYYNIYSYRSIEYLWVVIWSCYTIIYITKDQVITCEWVYDPIILYTYYNIYSYRSSDYLWVDVCMILLYYNIYSYTYIKWLPVSVCMYDPAILKYIFLKINWLPVSGCMIQIMDTMTLWSGYQLKLKSAQVTY